MNQEFPMARFRELDDAELVGLLVHDPVARLDVVEFFYREYGEVLMAVAIAVVKSATGRCGAVDFNRTSNQLHQGASHENHRSIGRHELGEHRRLLPRRQ